RHLGGSAMKTTVNAALLFLMISMAPAYADDNVLCVQEQLASRGANPGPIDGQLGSRTIVAGQSLGVALGLPPLTTGTAPQWCQALVPTSSVPVPQSGPRRSFSGVYPSLCPRYVVDPDDPCFW